MNKNPNSLFLFCCSLVPGAGYMYLGAMRKGLEAMFLFFGCTIMFAWLQLDAFAAMIGIPLWFYYFFDTFVLRNKLQSGEPIADESGVLDTLGKMGEQRYYYIGIGLVIIGALALLTNLTSDIRWQLAQYVRNYLPSLLLIALGTLLLIRSKNGHQAPAVPAVSPSRPAGPQAPDTAGPLFPEEKTDAPLNEPNAADSTPEE